jgi:antitoxin MazE
MEVSIIQIGNSKGLRLSKTILDKYQIKEKLEMILENDHIILRPFKEPRQGWSEAFIEMHVAGDDQLLIDDVFDDENFDEWN